MDHTPGFSSSSAAPHPSEGSLSRGLRWSFIIHGVAIAAIFIKTVVFPGEPVVYTPTLRVDMVGLPDLLKKDLAKIPKQPTSEDLNEALKQAEADAQNYKAPKTQDVVEKAPEETAKPDEMVMNPKKVQPREDKKEIARKNRERLKELTQERPRDKKLKNSLARLKSLAKISEFENKGPNSPVIKGNAISKGTSLSGDAKENAEAGYYDLIRDRLQENWALPVWIARQKLSAQIQIYLDSRGRLTAMKIIKSSGNPQFDEAVKKTVSDSQPYPRPPAALAGSLFSSGILVGFPL